MEMDLWGSVNNADASFQPIQKKSVLIELKGEHRANKQIKNVLID